MTLFDHKPELPFTCPRCGQLFERSLSLDGKTVQGHVVGDPRTCIPTGPILGAARDARARREARRRL